MADNYQDDDEQALALITKAMGAAISGVTPAVVKNLAKSITRLCTALIDYPVAALEGSIEAKKAESKSRVKLIDAAGKQLVKNMDVDPEYAKLASDKYAQRIVRERLNVDKTVAVAIAEIANNPPSGKTAAEQTPLISDDWLNVFEAEASNMSSQQMQLLFGKILAGEIRKPSTFSIKTLKTMAQLDGSAAAKFKRFCGLVTSIWIANSAVLDARVLVFSGDAGSNALAKYGFPYSELNMLSEYGLITSDYDAYRDYGICIAQPTATLPLRFQGKPYVLIPDQDRANVSAPQFHGPALSNVGRELLPIIDVDPAPDYEAELRQYLATQQFTLAEA